MPRYASLYERLVANTHEPTSDQGCWVWKGRRDRWGYGHVNVRIDGKHTTLKAHVAMLQAVGVEVADGQHRDHLCRNPSCINPDHIEPVTVRENMRRRSAARVSPTAARV